MPQARCDVDKIVALYEDDNSIDKVAERIGASAEFVKTRLVDAGVQLRAYTYKRMPVLEMARYYESGNSLKQTAKRFDTSINTVRRRFVDAGVAIRSRGGRGGYHRRIDDGKRDDEMIALYVAGHSQRDIAKSYGMSRQRVGRILSRNGITPADKGEAIHEQSAADETNATASKLLSARWGTV